MKRNLLALLLVGSFSLALVRAREEFRSRERDGLTSGVTDAGPDIGGAFELAPADGGGMGTACAGADITGSAGQTVALVRAGDVVCTPLGLANAGITDHSLSYLTTNQMRVVPDDAGILSLYIEGASTNYLLYSQASSLGGWSFSATYTDDQTAPDSNDGAGLLEDTSAVAAQNMSQAISTTTTGNWIFSTYLKAGTLSTATLKLISAGPSVTTTCSVTGLSSSTWTRVWCTRNVVTSVTSLTVEIYPGDSATVGNTGTIYVWGEQLEQGSDTSSYIYTAGASAARVADKYTITGVSMPLVPSVARVKVQGMRSQGAANAQAFVTIGAAGYRRLWRTGGVFQMDRGDPTITANAAAVTTDGFLRGLSQTNGASATAIACLNGTCSATTTGNSTASATGTTNSVGHNSVSGLQINGLLNQLCVDSDLNRCNTY